MSVPGLSHRCSTRSAPPAARAVATVVVVRTSATIMRAGAAGSPCSAARFLASVEPFRFGTMWLRK